MLRYIEEHSHEPLNLPHLAAVACMSTYHFLRTFRRMVGMTPHQFLLDVRIRRAATALCTTRAPITQIAFEAGFNDLSTFNARFRRVFGTSPGRLRSSGNGPVATTGGTRQPSSTGASSRLPHSAQEPS